MVKKHFPINVPDWARGMVWYQIFPERFNNGDPNNTPRAVDQKNAWPHDHLSLLERHPWESDWYKLQPYELQNGKDFWYNIQRRRYGGDLLGIMDRLDYLEDLGIGALYLNPVFMAPSHHKYDAACYHHVDPHFGPDPEGDRALMANETPYDPSTWAWTSADEQLLMLIEELHRRKMYIILDGVFNHMGLNSWIYQDILKNQKHSEFRDWLEIESWADDHRAANHNGTAQNAEIDFTNPENAFRDGFRVRTWEGFLELPELRQDRRGIVDGPRKYIFDITRRWMDPYHNGDPANGVDGWRLDVAYCIKHPFWKDWRNHVRSINPEAYLVAEVIDSVQNTQPYLKGDEFDAVMNYQFMRACNRFFIGTDQRLPATGFTDRLLELQKAYPDPVGHVMQNLLGSHDTDRVASRIVNKKINLGQSWQEFFQRTRAVHGFYDTRKPDSEERSIQKLMVMVQLTWPGAPMIYYGDESGMWGANDPCCRKPMVWHDMEYEPESVHPDGSGRLRPDDVTFDEDLYRWHRALIHLRKSNPALQYGDVEILSANDATGVIVYRRRNNENEVLTALHNGKGNAMVTLTDYLTDHLNPDTVQPVLTGDVAMESTSENTGDAIQPEPGKDRRSPRHWIQMGPYSGIVIPFNKRYPG